MEKVLSNIAKIGFGVFALLSLASQNGMLDSMRTKEAARYLKGTGVKEVASVTEEWRDKSPYQIDGYNPQVRRKITFRDGSHTTLTYRTLAWQSLMTWKNGEMFNPQPNERYQVTSSNELVKKTQDAIEN